MWIMLALASLTLAAAPAAEPQPEPAAEAQEHAAPEADGMVPMVELMLQGRTVEGRLVYEDEQIIRVEALGAGIIGYVRSTIREVRRFTITESAYHERLGDHHHGLVWATEDAPTEFARARQEYQRALLAADADEDRVRLKTKLDVLAADRDEWQREVLRAQQLDLARHEVDLAILEKQLTKERIEAVQRQEQELQALRAAVQRMQADGQVLTRMVEDLRADLQDLEEDVDDLDDLDSFFVRTNVFVDLRRSHERLEREVQRLQRSGGAK
jgi:hypothetical protein